MSNKSSRPWLFLILIVIFLGVFFRVANLGEKIYWVDEVSTSLRLSGYSKQEVISQLSQQSIISIADLQKYQKLSPEKDWSDTLEALKTSPEHSPLYFLLARGWVELWGESITVIRSLSVIFSLSALFCLYYLGQELFNSKQVGIISVLLMTVSPFFVAYAQEARPYSLWTITIILSSLTLLRAIRHNNWLSWSVYSLSLIFSLYTSLLSILVILAQVLYVLVISKVFKNLFISVSIAFLSFSPWLIVILSSWQKLEENTTWMNDSIGLFPMIAVWLYSIAIIFVESPIHSYLDLPMLTRMIVDLSLFTLIGFAFYFLVSKTKIRVSWFIVSIALIPRIIMILSDLIQQKQASIAPRYMIPLYICIQLTLGYLFTCKIFKSNVENQQQQQKWKIILIAIISLGILSCNFNLDKSPKYQKTRNLDNIVIANIINQPPNTLVISEEKNILDLISLSYNFKKKVKVKLLNSGSDDLEQVQQQFSTIFLFNPSGEILLKIKNQNWVNLQQIFQPNLLIPDEIHLSLWKIKN